VEAATDPGPARRAWAEGGAEAAGLAVGGVSEGQAGGGVGRRRSQLAGTSGLSGG